MINYKLRGLSHIWGCATTGGLFLLTETCSDAHTCLVPNDQHNEESLTPGGYREIIKLKAVLSSDVSYLLKDTDTDKDMDTVNRVETMESPSIHRS